MRRSNPLVFLCVLAAAFAQDSPTPNKPASVEGVVTDSVTGAPVTRAHVTLQGKVSAQTAKRYGATSGPDGRFSFPEVEPGPYSLEVKHAAFVDGLARIELKSDDRNTAADVRLIPTGTILGRVIDPSGEPVQGAAVEARTAADLVAFRNTDERGEFRIGGLAPGRYYVRAALGHQSDGPPEIRTDGTAEVLTAPTWFPGVMTRLEATRVQVRPGVESTGVEVRLLRTPFVRVSGKIVGMPPTRDLPSVGLTAWDDGAGISLPLKPDGSFETWRLTPGNYRLQGEWTTPTGQRVRTTNTEIQLSTANIDNIELRVVPDSTITGRLEFDDEQAKQSPDSSKYRVLRMVMLTRVTGEGIVVDSKLSDDNTFRLDKVPAGKYRVAINWVEAWIRSMSFGSTSIDGPWLDLSNGSNGSELVLRLSAATGSISGSVQSEDGAADDRTVILTSTDKNFALRTTGVSPDGTYSFPHVPSGSYQIIALHEADREYAGNAVPGFEKWLEPIDVPAGGKVTKDLKPRALE